MAAPPDAVPAFSTFRLANSLLQTDPRNRPKSVPPLQSRFMSRMLLHQVNCPDGTTGEMSISVPCAAPMYLSVEPLLGWLPNSQLPAPQPISDTSGTRICSPVVQ